MTTVGARIKQLRRDKGVSQAQLAAAIKTTQGTISDWERGESKTPSGALLYKLCEFFGTTPLFILRGEGPRHAAPAGDRMSDLLNRWEVALNFSPEALRLARDVDTISDELTRYRAVNAALRAIEWVRSGNPADAAEPAASAPGVASPSPAQEPPPETPADNDGERP